MRKILFLTAFAALLLTGCAKEQMFEMPAGDGKLTDVTFTAQMNNVVSTKALADGDGAAASVNRCIMEIYYGDDLFTRMYAPVSDKKASFTVQLVSNRTYKVAFWADCVADASSEAGLAADNYYTTTDGLGAIALKGTYAGNLDARDAFALCKNFTVAQGGSTFNAVLRRPFAQINVITTDVAIVKKVAALVPDKVDVTLKNAATKYSVLDSAAVAGQVADLNYVASVYNWDATKSECTLSMDYIFAEKEKGVIDIDWEALHGTDANVEHSFTSVPYQRNYRTNIKGALLTTTGKWNVTVDPIWESSQAGEEEILYEVVADIAGANNVIQNAVGEGQSEINVKFSSEPNDAGTPGAASGDIISKAIVTTSLPEDSKLNILIEAETKDLYIGDYQSETNTTVVTSGTESAVVNLNIPPTSGIQKLIINAPSKTVYLNGVQVSNTGVIDDLDAIVSQSTLIVEKGQTVKKLTIRQGGLEIHGVVENLVIAENAHDTNPVKVRDCENLSAEVFAVIKGEGHNYIDTPAYSEKANSDGTYDIVPSVCKIGADKGFATLAQAIAAVGDGETITFVANEINATGISVASGKNFTVDFADHIYTVNKPGAGSTGTQTSAFQLLDGSTITFKNGVIKADKDNLTEAVAPAKNIKRMFQSYANVTFQNMTIDGKNLYGNNAANEFACGTVSIEGATSISAKEGVKAINVDTWKDYYPAGAAVTINTTGTIGDIYLYAEGSAAGEFTKSSLTIKKGTFATISDDGSEDWTSAVSGGTFTADPTKYLAPKYEAVLGVDGLYHVNKVYDCGATIELPNGEVKEFNADEGASAVMKAISYIDFTLYTEFPAADYPGYIPVIKMHKDDTVWNTHAHATKPSKYGSCTFQQPYTSVLDGQGHTLTSTKNVPSGYKINTTGLIKVMNKANVTIKNLVFKPTNADLYNIDVTAGSIVTLEDVVLNLASSWAIENNASTIKYKNVQFPASRQYDGTSNAVADIFLAGGPYKFNCKATTTAYIGTSFTPAVESIGNRVDAATWEENAICYCTNDFIFHIAAEVPSSEEISAAIPSTYKGKTIYYCGNDGLKNLFRMMARVGTAFESITIYKTSSATKQLSNGSSIAVTFEGDAVYNNNFTAGSGYHIEASEPVGKTVTYTSVAD